MTYTAKELEHLRGHREDEIRLHGEYPFDGPRIGFQGGDADLDGGKIGLKRGDVGLDRGKIGLRGEFVAIGGCRLVQRFRMRFGLAAFDSGRFEVAGNLEGVGRSRERGSSS